MSIEKHIKIDDIDLVDTAVSGENPDYILAHRDEFVELLENSDPTVMGNIADFRPELLDTHTNQVMLVELEIGQNQKDALASSNKMRFFEIMYGEKPIIAVFKPGSGESKVRLEDFQVPNMYTRERAAYIIDYFMNLGIVPPTILKNIDGEEGSMQLYIPHTTAQSPNINRELDENQDFSGLDWKKMAMLDKLIGNADRNSGNYLVCFSEPSRFFAIDHGASFCRPKAGDENLAYKYFKNNPQLGQLDDNLRNSLQKLLENEEQVMSSLPNNVSGYIKYEKFKKIPTIFDKARKMLETNSILI